MTASELRAYKHSQFGHFNNIVYKPDYALSARINDLIDQGKVKYYAS